jgi:hypothetical protein
MVSVMKAMMVIARHPPIKVILVAAVQAAVDMAAVDMAAAVTAAAAAAVVAEVALVHRAVAPAAHQCPLKSSVLARESSNFSMAKKVLVSFR